MSTFIHGIASAQSLDKSGEIVDIKGLDITSLARTGTITWEHNAGKDANGNAISINLPAQVVGKILKAKKIFDKKDCADDNELLFWNKAKVPFVYIAAELLDDYCDSARECAGKFKYSSANPSQEAILGFSVEGSEIPGTRKGMLITRSIGRKVTLTVAPCNSLCTAEILENQKPQIKDDFEELFKNTEEAITLFKSGEGTKIYETYLAKKEHEPKPPAFDHKKAAEHHRKSAVSAEDAKTADHHIEKMKFHNNAALSEVKKSEKGLCELHKARVDEGKTDQEKMATRGKRNFRQKVNEGPMNQGTPIGAPKKIVGVPIHNEKGVHRMALGQPSETRSQGISSMGRAVRQGKLSNAKDAVAVARSGINKIKTNLPKSEPDGNLKKALTAGGMNASPSTLVNGSAYQTESLGSKQATTGAENNAFQGTKKKDWNKRARDDYQNWPHREKFEKFMQARMPHLAMGEIKAIGRTLALKKSIDFEKSLDSLVSFTKSELDEKSLKDIQKETAETWAKRAEEAYKKAIEEKSVKWLMDATEYGHEAIEHSSLSEDLSTFEKIRAKLIPLHKKAIKLLISNDK
jgi:hypothetical protein